MLKDKQPRQPAAGMTFAPGPSPGTVRAANGDVLTVPEGWALLPPVAYVVYAMIRGTLDGWYAYWFMNPATQTPRAFASCIAILLGGFSLAAAVLVAADRMIGKRAAAPATV